MKRDPEMLEEYDFRSGIRGKYAIRDTAGTNIVVIDPDLLEFFPDHDAVNDALHGLAAIIRNQKKTKPAARRGDRPRARATR